MRRFLNHAFLLLLCAAVSIASAQSFGRLPSVGASKLSSSLRTLVSGAGIDGVRGIGRHAAVVGHVCAFVRTSDASADVLSANGCRVIDRVGDIFIADIPVLRLYSLASDSRVCRIEAECGNEMQLDSMRLYTNSANVYTGRLLPQAYTGRGVVVGVMDVGFDLTHPTFLGADGHSRISRFWDQLSADTVGSSMYVGAEYVGEQDIMAYAHSRDGEVIYHGTHTLGIAAGSGAGTPYVGMAPEGELCLVSNAVSGDEDFIADKDMYRYTTATDVLGFKYIFDYAASVGKPCVISFSEGAPQDFRGDNQLYYEALGKLVGPGRILVASAGNNAVHYNYVAKPRGRQSAGTFVASSDDYVAVTTKASDEVSLRTTLYNISADAVDVRSCSSTCVTVADNQLQLCVSAADVCLAADSTVADTVVVGGVEYVHTVRAYRSCFNADDIAMDVVVSGPVGIGHSSSGHRVSVELFGESADAEFFLVHGAFAVYKENLQLNDADITHCILSPGSAPSVICVGSTSYRPQFVNADGKQKGTVWGETGYRSSFSSIGPTFDGRTKPDVMAPGANIVSAMSSYYMASNPDRLDWLVSRQEHEGRTYGWCADCGTSMSAPAVAGIIATWLQARPNLSPDDVMQTLRRTCRPCGDYGEQTTQYCGYGAIDGYAGLLDVLGLTGIGGLSAENPHDVSVGVCGSELVIAFGSVPADAFGVQVYALNGQKLMSRRLKGGKKEYRMETDLPEGVYAVQINAWKRERSGSVLVRIEK